MVYFPFPKPENGYEAMRQAKIVERVAEMMPALRKGGEYDTYDCGNGNYGMMKRSYSNAPDTTYCIRLEPTFFCSCPDFEKHQNFCKHIVALTTLQEEQKSEAQAELFTEDYLLQAAMMEADAIDSDLRGNYGIAY